MLLAGMFRGSREELAKKAICKSGGFRAIKAFWVWIFVGTQFLLVAGAAS